MCTENYLTIDLRARNSLGRYPQLVEVVILELWTIDLRRYVGPDVRVQSVCEVAAGIGGRIPRMTTEIEAGYPRASTRASGLIATNADRVRYAPKVKTRGAGRRLDHPISGEWRCVRI